MRLPAKLLFTILLTTSVSCDSPDDRSSSQPAPTVQTIVPGDRFEIAGSLKEQKDATTAPEFLFEKNFALAVSREVPLATEIESLDMDCENGADLDGPWFTLYGEEGEIVSSTDPYLTILSDGFNLDTNDSFPGKLKVGNANLTARLYGHKPCSVDVSAIIQQQSDVIHLEPGEWDPNLDGVFETRIDQTQRHQFEFTESGTMIERKIKGKSLVLEVLYSVEIDGSVLPGRMLISVKKIMRADAGSTLAIGEARSCIYRLFPDFDESIAMWLRCASDDYPDKFSYPLRKYKNL